MAQTPETIGFIFVEQFALMSAAAAIEPLRAANLLSGKQLYSVEYLSPKGGFIASSCGGGFETTGFDNARAHHDMLFMVAGANPFKANTKTEIAYLRRKSAQGTALGGISGGSVPLARAGLVKDRRFTVHWEHVEALTEDNPDHLIERRLFVLDRDRATCAGGIAPMDMMHALVRGKHGEALANAVSDWFIHTHLRPAEDPQRSAKNDARGLHPAVASASRLMEDHIAEPLGLAQLARLSGLSPRQLQRHFRRDLGLSVMQHYTRIRLSKADELLRQTRLPIGQVSIVTGFSNQSNFSRAYAKAFGRSPGATRTAIG